MSGTVIARVRFTKRWSHFNRGEVAVFPLEQAERLVAQRVAEGLPPPIGAVPPAPPPGGQEGGAAPPARQPAQVVRK